MNLRASCVLLVIGLVTPAARLTADATYWLYPPTVDGEIAHYPLFVEFTGNGGEQMAFFGVDVSSSHPDLTVQHSDYSAFQFSKALPLLDTWQQLPGAEFGPGTMKSTVEYETAVSYVPAGRHHLGDLLVDFSGTGLQAGTLDVIGLDSPDSVIGLEVPGNPETFHFVDVNVVVVPEPGGNATLLSMAVAWIFAFGRRRRGWS